MEGKTGTISAPAKPHFAEIVIAIVTGLSLAFTAIFFCVVPVSDIANGRDYIVFWATGQQLVHHASPYNIAAMTQLEYSAGFSVKTGVLLMRNPPCYLFLTLPLGFLSIHAGALLWSLLLLGCLYLSVRLLWRMHGSPSGPLHWMGISFAPALLCLMMGQTTLFALLGYVLFLRYHATRPFLAGAALWLCTLKPHLFLAFGVVLLLWMVVTRSYKILLGGVAVLTASCAIQFLIDPTAWTDYFHMMRAQGVDLAPVPCLSVALRLWLSPHTMAITYLPAALGCIWALGYFWTRRARWDWKRHGSLLVLVSLLTAPYAWVYDDGLAIPALLDAAYLTRSRILLVALALTSFGIEIMLGYGMKIQSKDYLWTAPAWLAWVLLARVFARKPLPGQSASAESETLSSAS